MWLQIRQTYIAQFYLKLISNSVQRVFVFLFLTMCTFKVISSRKQACELDTGVSRSRLGLIEMLMRGRWCQQTLHAVERVGSPQEFFPCFVLNSNTCRNYEGDILHCHVTGVKYVHNYARHLPEQHLECVCLSICTHAFMFDTWMFYYHWKQKPAAYLQIQTATYEWTDESGQLQNKYYNF